MGIFTIVLPDVGEGIAEAELTEWNVTVGDMVEEDDILGAVMTDKAAVEIPSSVAGKVSWLAGQEGDTIAVGGSFAKIEVDGEGNEAQTDAAADTAAPLEKPAELVTTKTPISTPKSSVPKPASATTMRGEGEKPLAAPSVRKRAQDAGVDLRRVPGSGPAGRITHDDLDVFFEHGVIVQGGTSRQENAGVKDIRVVGMRRKIAQKMALSKSRIPHITIVEEVDVTNLEELRSKLNAKHQEARGKLTVLPFIMRAIVEAVKEQPSLNAHYDDEAGVIHQFGGVHIGIATQTPSGLTVPVVKHAEAQTPWEGAAELNRLASVARTGKASLEELTGSTITITSLGPLGAIATTPIINHPEVAIVGVNKMQIRPMWDGQQFQPRTMMNISCSFDHRVIDGWDAAVFVQKLKSLLETPAMLFVES